MSNDLSSSSQKANGPLLTLLERITAVLLIAVMIAIGWIVLIAYQPSIFRLASDEAEVLIIVSLLVVTLGMVSLVALLHTRGTPHGHS